MCRLKVCKLHEQFSILLSNVHVVILSVSTKRDYKSVSMYGDTGYMEGNNKVDYTIVLPSCLVNFR